MLNAGGQRGQANLVAAQFSDFGFAQAGAPANDKFFPDGDMTCTGQVRFGQAGQGAASTVALLVPCAELVRDGRTDDTVDVAVGTAFGDINPDRAVRDALDQLGASGSGNRLGQRRPRCGRLTTACDAGRRPLDARRGPRGDLRLRRRSSRRRAMLAAVPGARSPGLTVPVRRTHRARSPDPPCSFAGLTVAKRPTHRARRRTHRADRPTHRARLPDSPCAIRPTHRGETLDSPCPFARLTVAKRPTHR